MLSLHWFVFVFPLIFSPGPVNLLVASIGAQFGPRHAIPFLLGVNSVNVIYVLSIGLGVGELLESYNHVSRWITYAGAAFLVYLAIKFFRSANNPRQMSDALPGFWEGVLVMALNGKNVTIVALMFSHFLGAHAPTATTLKMAGLYLSFCVLCQTTWTWGGHALSKVLLSKNSLRMQAYVYGSMLLAVALWMALEC